MFTYIFIFICFCITKHTEILKIKNNLNAKFHMLSKFFTNKQQGCILYPLE